MDLDYNGLSCGILSAAGRGTTVDSLCFSMLNLYPASWIETEERILTSDNFNFAHTN